MAFKLVELFAEITARDGQFRDAMGNVRVSAETGQQRLAGLETAAKNALLAFGGYIAIRQMTRFVRESIDAFAEYEANLNRVSAALNVIGANAGVGTARIKAFASEIQRLTTVGDDAVLQMAQLGISVGRLTGDELEQGIKAAIGFSRALGIDVQTAMMLISRAAQGNTTLLSRYGIQIDQTASSQEQFNQVLRQGVENFAIARAEIETAAGAQSQLKNAVEDLMKAFGEGLAPSIAGVSKQLDEITTRHTPLLQRFGQILGDNAEFILMMTNGLADWVRGMDEVDHAIRAVPRSTEEAAGAIQTLWKALQAGDPRASNIEAAIARLNRESDRMRSEGLKEKTSLPSAEEDAGPAMTEKEVAEHEKNLDRVRRLEFDLAQDARNETEQRIALVQKEAQERIDAVESALKQNIYDEFEAHERIKEIRQLAADKSEEIQKNADEQEAARKRQLEEDEQRRIEDHERRLTQAQDREERERGRLQAARERLDEAAARQNQVKTSDLFGFLQQIQDSVGGREREQIEKLDRQIELHEQELSKLEDVRKAIEDNAGLQIV